MPRKSPDEEWDPDAYEAEQYQRERAARLRREAEAGLWRAAWAKERAKPILQRRFFSFAEIAEQLSQNPRTLETNPGLRERIIEDLTRSAQNRRFAAREVVALTSDRPVFRAFKLKPGEILVPDDGEVLALRREAGRRYVQARLKLPGAASLLREWFDIPAAPETSRIDEKAAAIPKRDNASEPDDTNERTSLNSTVSYLALKAEIEKHGPGTEAKLTLHATQSFPGKHVPRALLRKARDQVHGKPKLGRPPKTADKSPQ